MAFGLIRSISAHPSTGALRNTDQARPNRIEKATGSEKNDEAAPLASFATPACWRASRSLVFAPSARQRTTTAEAEGRRKHARPAFMAP